MSVNEKKPMINPIPAQDETGKEWFYFNLHNLVTFRVAQSAATASLFTDMFGPFLTSTGEHFDLTITDQHEPLIGGAFGEAHGETDFYYNDAGVFLEAPGVQVFLDEDGFRLHGTSELLVMALPLIDRLMVTRQAAMIHALTVAYRGHGICMPAWGGTGKTSTMSKLVTMPGFSFMGDDWAFLTDDGQLLGYAKPMFIKPYHRPLYPHLFKNRHKPLIPIRFSKPIAKITTLVHPYITRYPNLARITRRWSPEHMMVTPRQAFPNAVFSEAAPLAGSLFVERYQSDTAEVQFEEKDTSWMVSKMIGNFNAEMPKHARLVMTALGAAGLVPIERAFCEKAAVLRQALEGKPSFHLRVPQAFTPDQASDAIIEKIQELIRFTNIG
jgi:hypothetical protein